MMLGPPEDPNPNTQVVFPSSHELVTVFGKCPEKIGHFTDSDKSATFPNNISGILRRHKEHKAVYN